MKVISASRREDMPAFHMNELMAKYKAMGDDTFWVLWTKNPKKIIDSGMDFKRVALQLTVTGLGGTDWEPNVPHPKKVWDDVAILIKQGFNPDLINWRFDPIIRANTDDIRMGANQFSSNHGMTYGMAQIAADLGITRCVTSFVTFYGVVKSRWQDWEQSQFTEAEQIEMTKALKSILNYHKIELYGCVQPHLSGLIKPSACIDGKYYESILGLDFSADKDKYQRKHCNCTASYDIGKYRKCAHGCVYCYSRENQEEGKSASEIDFDEV